MDLRWPRRRTNGYTPHSPRLTPPLVPNSSSGKPAVTGVILAGGRSTRMGRPKEGVLMADGRCMIEHVAEALIPHVRQLIVVGECRGFDPAKLRAISLPDYAPDAGPFAGMLAALLSQQSSHYLFVACDQPYLTTEHIARLMPPEGMVAFSDERGAPLLPFPCLVPETTAPDALHAFESGERSPRRWLGRHPILWKLLPGGEEWRLRGVNSPDDLLQP